MTSGLSKAAISLAPTASTASCADQLNGCVNGSHGSVVVLATPNSGPATCEWRALQAIGLSAVPVHHVGALPGVVLRRRPDLVLLDIALCGTFELNVVAALATANSGTAVVIYGSLPDAAVRTALLHAGADDCVPSPYLLDELMARVLAVLRRTRLATAPSRSLDPLVAGPLSLDIDQHSVFVGGRRTELTLIEFRLLTYLLQHRGEALSRERLLADVWGYTIGTLETVTVHISRLRRKIEANPSQPVWIETVWGLGYRFRGEPAERSKAVAFSSASSGRPPVLATAG